MTTAEDIINYIRFSKEPVDGYSNVKIKGKHSICSTCKNFNDGVCKKGYSFAGFAVKLDECNNWEVCNG